MLAERAGHRVRIVDGDVSNIKITTPEDLPIAEAIAGALEEHGLRRPGAARTGRAGTGYDLHRLVTGRPLVIGGVTIPFDRGALGHSDADVVCHALTDAMLGAASLGDIGGIFRIPTRSGRMRRASSCSGAPSRWRPRGVRGRQRRRHGDSRSAEDRDRTSTRCARAIAAAIGIDVSRVSIKAKTNEGVDAVGRGEAIAAACRARCCDPSVDAVRDR